MNARMIKKNDPISRATETFNRMISTDLSGFFERKIYPIYQQAQKNRWITENESETGRWRELNPRYEEYKKRRYAQYPGSGTKKLIATSKLVTAATGQGMGLNKIVMPGSIRIAIDLGRVPYAQKVADEFDIMKFGPTTLNVMKSAVKEYIKSRIKA